MEERERDSTALKSLGDECCAFSHATLTGSNDRQPQTTSEITRRSSSWLFVHDHCLFGKMTEKAKLHMHLCLGGRARQTVADLAGLFNMAFISGIVH